MIFVLLPVLALAISNQAFAGGIQQATSCSAREGKIGVEVTYKEKSAVSMWDLRITLNKIERVHVPVICFAAASPGGARF